MFNIQLKDVHVGQAIKKRYEATGMTKTEFGRLIGVPQQHINRIFERDTMETKKLAKICQALDYNFFALFCEFPTNVNAYLAAVALGNGDANNNIGEAAVLAEIELYKERVGGLKENTSTLKDQISTLKDTVEQLKSQLRDKDELIAIYKERVINK
ncbi:helix-turn-helix transcriptional regulator [Paramuribaculum intestinale]|uniref:helix-turn-helix domain-containing protein n=1 Tax=Paramuribaculum intestinale TaxID=2094151 RepID=UPI0023A83BD3|nr:helix-turn-helix transcriptional regulator [Paramuribaculum intestinale]